MTWRDAKLSGAVVTNTRRSRISLPQDFGDIIAVSSKIYKWLVILSIYLYSILFYVHKSVLGSKYLFFTGSRLPLKKGLSAPAPCNLFYRLQLCISLKRPSSLAPQLSALIFIYLPVGFI